MTIFNIVVHKKRNGKSQQCFFAGHFQVNKKIKTIAGRGWWGKFKCWVVGSTCFFLRGEW